MRWKLKVCQWPCAAAVCVGFITTQTEAQDAALLAEIEEGKALEQAGRFAQARGRFAEMLLAAQKTAPNTSTVAVILSNLATSYADLGAYADSERIHKQALALFEATLGKDDPETAGASINLASLYAETGRISAAEQLLDPALRISLDRLGPDHPQVAEIFEELGMVRVLEHRYSEAELLFGRALLIYQKRGAGSGVEVGHVFNELARAAIGLSLPSKALSYATRALETWQAIPNAPPGGLVKTFNFLGAGYFLTDQLPEADALFKRALQAAEATYGPDHPVVADTLRNYAVVLKRLNRGREAKKAERRAALILAASAKNNSLAYTVDVSAFVATDARR